MYCRCPVLPRHTWKWRFLFYRWMLPIFASSGVDLHLHPQYRPGTANRKISGSSWNNDISVQYSILFQGSCESLTMNDVLNKAIILTLHDWIRNIIKSCPAKNKTRTVLGYVIHYRCSLFVSLFKVLVLKLFADSYRCVLERPWDQVGNTKYFMPEGWRLDVTSYIYVFHQLPCNAMKYIWLSRSSVAQFELFFHNWYNELAILSISRQTGRLETNITRIVNMIYHTLNSLHHWWRKVSPCKWPFWMKQKDTVNNVWVWRDTFTWIQNTVVIEQSNITW